VKPWTPFDEPYDIHTNRVLAFMLGRGKPLAHFCDAYPPEPSEDVIPRAAFAAYVADAPDATFETCEFVQLLRSQSPHNPQVRGTIHVFYAQGSEAWRIDAYIAMIVEEEKSRWSELLERQQGTLLGYTDEQNKQHLEHMLRAPHASDFPWLRRLIQERSL
jgi:hypothetical protein